MKYIVYPYSMTSESGKALARSLRAKRVYPDGKYKPTKDDIVINWGNSKIPKWSLDKSKVVLNDPRNVALAVDKLDTFTILQEYEVPVPRFTEDIEEAKDFEGLVYCRNTSTGHGGEGIEVRSKDDLIPAKFYTEKIVGKEFRVHIFLDRCIDLQAKKRSKVALEEDSLDEDIRNHGNGWVFCRNSDETKEVKEELIDLARRSLWALGLDFGAVDIIYNKTGGYVLEVNTACGLSNTTLNNYLLAFNNFKNA